MAETKLERAGHNGEFHEGDFVKLNFKDGHIEEDWSVIGADPDRSGYVLVEKVDHLGRAKTLPVSLEKLKEYNSVKPTESADDLLDESIPNFDIDQALNVAGFAEFLARHKNQGVEVNIEDRADVGQRFEAFEKEKTVAKSYQTIIREEIFGETGVKLNPEQLVSIDAYLEREAIIDPEKIKERDELIKAFKAGREEIKKLEARLAQFAEAQPGVISGEAKTKLEELGGQLEEVKSKHKLIALIQEGKKGFLGLLWSREQRQAVKLLESEKLGVADATKMASDIDRLQKEIGQIQEAVADKEKLRATKQQVDQKRQQLLEDGELLQTTHQAAADQAKRQLLKLFDPGWAYAKDHQPDLKTLTEAQAYFSHLLDLKEQSDLQRDYVPSFDATEAAKYQSALDGHLESAVADEIERVATGSRLGAGALDHLTDSLAKHYLNLETLGSKDQGETREFLRQTLIGLAEEWSKSNDQQAVAKSFLLKRVLIKFNQADNES